MSLGVKLPLPTAAAAVSPYAMCNPTPNGIAELVGALGCKPAECSTIELLTLSTAVAAPGTPAGNVQASLWQSNGMITHT